MTPTPRARALVAAGLIVFGPLAAAAGRVDLVGLRTPVAPWNQRSEASGINDAGQVVGTGLMVSSALPFLYADGTMRDLGTLGGTASQATGINDAGTVVGWASLANNSAHAFMYEGGLMRDLGSQGGPDSEARGINATGQVVGWAQSADGVRHDFLVSAGSMHRLGTLAPADTLLGDGAAINAHGQITGTRWLGVTQEADLLTLHPDWQGGNGNWADASYWHYAGMGAFGFTPGLPLDVLISTRGSATVWGPADATVNRLTVQAANGQLATLNLAGGRIWVRDDGSFIVTAGFTPGAGAAQVVLDGSVNFEGGALVMQFGGTAPGSGHDKLVLGGPVGLTGASLQLQWLGGWAGHAGDHYDLFDWNDGLAGNFASISLPTLGDGLAWDRSHLSASGELRITAVPEPGPWALLAAGLAVLGARARRRSRPQN